NDKLPSPPLTPVIHDIVHNELFNVFPSSLASGLPPDGVDPPFQPVIHLSITELDKLRKQLDDLLSKGFFKPSTLPYGIPVLF
ncbi:hypothetical protein BG015_002771, partial [Linnemannia schmuckeri]